VAISDDEPRLTSRIEKSWNRTLLKRLLRGSCGLASLRHIYALVETILLEPDSDQLKITLKATWREC
jgi:hypothetical protein